MNQVSEVLHMKKSLQKIRVVTMKIRSLLCFTTQPHNDLGWENSRDVHSSMGMKVHSSMGMKVSKEKESMKYLRSEDICELCPPIRRAQNASNPTIVLLETRTCL